MKQRQILKVRFIFMFFLLGFINVVTAQDSTAGEPTVKLRYFIKNNNTHFLQIETGLKEGRKFTILPNQVVKLFLDSNKVENLIAKSYTDQRGRATIFIPASLKDLWNSNATHSFIAVLEATSVEEERTTTIDITKARITIDTANNEGTRAITAMVESYANNVWKPVADVEIKVGIRRLGSILPGGEKITYTTDSTGKISVDFNKDSMPGDQKGNLVLAAEVEDNDQFGNLMAEKTVAWGVPAKQDRNFFSQRTLWSTRSGTPWWLLLMAGSIVLVVWGTIVYLIMQIVKIKKLSLINS